MKIIELDYFRHPSISFSSEGNGINLSLLYLVSDQMSGNGCLAIKIYWKFKKDIANLDNKRKSNIAMPPGNYERLIKLAEETFAVKTDPNQLDVNQEIIEQLLKLHPATVSEFSNENGPVAWLLVIPTTVDLMNRFLSKEISEKQLFEMTKPGTSFDALYLCSALVLEEYRKKGIIKSLAIKAIEDILRDHPIQCLFVWTFSKEGDMASDTISSLIELPLFKRPQ